MWLFIQTVIVVASSSFFFWPTQLVPVILSFRLYPTYVTYLSGISGSKQTYVLFSFVSLSSSSLHACLYYAYHRVRISSTSRSPLFIWGKLFPTGIKYPRPLLAISPPRILRRRLWQDDGLRAVEMNQSSHACPNVGMTYVDHDMMMIIIITIEPSAWANMIMSEKYGIHVCYATSTPPSP
ncbi:hypothetical protein M413DRAFT_293144 [Hebeloma cylindrosporum]|uniref:Uncharacterized protein n=1 Tax=Hebeloma cylindrosporum TaxID=76867 RepID=A0A0C3CPK9_HEBCY|nr:hypothetical protein M413DRAFT_293144 [Hebeloma cylindrosporum h7]